MTHTPLDSFESALLTELRQQVAERPVVDTTLRRPARHRVRRLAVGAVAAGLAASVVGVVGIGGPSSAYSVEQTGDGDVVVTVHRLDDAAGLEKALRAKGIDADVSYDEDGMSGIGIGPDGQPMNEDDLPPGGTGTGTEQPGTTSGGMDAPGAGEQQGTTSGNVDEPGTGEQGMDEPGFLEDDPCGMNRPHADLSQVNDDWVLRIPAGSPLMDRHVVIGTDADGGLSVFYGGDEPGQFCGVMQAR